MTTITRSGLVEVALPPEQALELFTAKGETLWVPGWAPLYIEPPSGEPVEGGLWLTTDTNADGQGRNQLHPDPERKSQTRADRIPTRSLVLLRALVGASLVRPAKPGVEVFQGRGRFFVGHAPTAPDPADCQMYRLPPCPKSRAR